MVQQDVELVRAACCVAALDGEITPRERAAIERLAEGPGIGAASIKAMLDMALKNKSWYEQQFRLAVKDPDRTMKALLSVAVVDGDFGENERIVLAHLGRKLGLDDARLEALFRAAQREVPGPS